MGLEILFSIEIEGTLITHISISTYANYIPGILEVATCIEAVAAQAYGIVATIQEFMHDEGFCIITVRIFALALQLLADDEAGTAYEAISIILLHTYALAGGVGVAPHVAIGQLCLGLDEPVILVHLFLAAVFSTQAASPVIKLAMVTINSVIIAVNATEACY